MFNFKNVITLIVLVTLTGACFGCSKDPSQAISSQVNVSKLHVKSKRLLGLENQEMMATAPAESIFALSSDNSRYEINLAEKYQKLSPEEYQPIFTRLVNSSLDQELYQLGHQYLTRSMTTWVNEGCNIIEEVLNTVLVGIPGDFRVLEEKNIDREASDPCFENYAQDYSLMMGLYKDLPMTLDGLKKDLKQMSQYQVYQVNDRVFVIHNNEETITISFFDDGNIHMDGLIREEGKVVAVVGQIPLFDATEESLKDRDGQVLPVIRQVECGDSNSNFCTEATGEDNVIFDFEEYYQISLQNTQN